MSDTANETAPKTRKSAASSETDRAMAAQARAEAALKELAAAVEELGKLQNRATVTVGGFRVSMSGPELIAVTSR